WNGTIKVPENDGTNYYIYTAEELAWVAYFVSFATANTFEGKTVYLMRDLDLNGSEFDWFPIGGRTNVGAVSTSNYFRGTFEGNHHKITNLKITKDTLYLTGLFGYVYGKSATVTAVIRNLGIIEPEINVNQAAAANYGVAALAGEAIYATFEHCFVRDGSVTGTYRVGGLVGSVNSYVSTFRNCYVQGVDVESTGVNASYCSAGALVGFIAAASVFENCYTAATTKVGVATTYKGGLIGQSTVANTINNSFVENDALYGSISTASTINYPTTAVAQGQIKTLVATLGSEYAYPNNAQHNNGYPVFACEAVEVILRTAYRSELDSEREKYKDMISAACPTEYASYLEVLNQAKAMVEDDVISSDEDQQAMADALKAAAEALAKVYNKSNNVVIPWDGVTETEPENDGTNYYIYRAEELAWVSSYVAAAADAEHRFTGKTIYVMKDLDLGGLNGANWTPIGGRDAKGLWSASYYFDGLFEGQGHLIKNLYVNTNQYQAGLFGYTYINTKIREIGIVNPQVIANPTTASGSGNYSATALVAFGYGTEIEACFVRGGSISTNGMISAAGILGTDYSSSASYFATVTDCYVEGTEITNTYASGAAGGIAGYISLSVTKFTNCYSTAKCDRGHTTDYAGAIIGWAANVAIVTNCYGASDIEGNEADSLVGHAGYQTGISGGGMVSVADFKAEGASAYLGTNYADDVNPAINNNFPILYWEDPEKNLRDLYEYELKSERMDAINAPLISAVFSTEYAEYLTALEEAKKIVKDNDTIDPIADINTAYDRLVEIKSDLFSKYNHSLDVTLPWNGTAYIDGELAEPDTDPDDANTYLIYRAEELAWVSYYVSLKNTLSGKTVKLMKDINLERTYVDENGETKRYNWTPIGARSADGTVSADYYFRGTFDGQHKKIYGLYIETDKVATGLFGYILGTSGAYVNIKNFGVVNPEIKATLAATTNDGIGVISGDVGYVNFEHIFVRGGSVESTYRASGFVGAVASSKGNIKMTNCYVQGTTVRATGTADATATAGGLISTNRTDATIITNCYSSAKLTSDYSQNNVGGIVAHANNTITITNSYSEGYALYGESPKVPTANGGSEQVEAGELKSYATVLGAEYTYDANEAINNGYPIFVCEETESLLTDAYYYEVYSERSDYAEDISKACPTEWEAYMNEMNAVKALINDDKNSSEEEMNTAIAALNTARDALKTAYYKAESVVIPWNGTTILEGTEMVPAIVDGAWEIYRAEELAYFASYVNGGQKMSGVTVKLMKDIDLDDINWTPIGGNGSTSIYFSGIFDGQHHKVYGLNIVSKTYAVGLFGFVFGASATNKAYIRNLGIIEPTVSSTYATTTSGNYGVAALAGAIEWAEVEHCFVRDGSVTAAFRAAGLVGSTITKTEANAQVIRNCYVQGTTVTSTGTNTSRSSAGALVAYNNAGITAIENCYVANVTISSE
ncbi:MAG: hypothetical protein IJM97_04060, partial [Clostridia bacterium]|nr:hypothetical protein [Clostridia bacterium]